MPRATSIVLCLTLMAFAGPGLSAQRKVVSPSAYATVEGPSRVGFPFTGTTTTRYQQICSIKGTPGVIQAVSFRRDNDVIVASADYVAFSTTLDLYLSTSPRSALTMSRTFAANIGPDVTKVFASTANWPAQVKVPPGPTGFAYTIPVSQPFFLFPGTGDILVDVHKYSSTNTNSMFFCDADSSGLGQGFASVKLGEGCPGAGKSEVVVYSSWFPGAMGRVLLWKAPSNTPALFVVGTSSTSFSGIPLPLDLAVIGAPGCPLYTNIFLSLAGVTSTSTTAYNSRWDLSLTVPADPALSGVTVYQQFLLVGDTFIGNAAALSTSQGYGVTLGFPVPGMPAQSETHDSSLTATEGALLQLGYGMVIEFTM